MDAQPECSGDPLERDQSKLELIAIQVITRFQG